MTDGFPATPGIKAAIARVEKGLLSAPAPDANAQTVALRDALSFIEGFEGDELQEGIDGPDGLIARIRAALGIVHQQDDGCPKSDPECLGNNGDRHDECESPRQFVQVRPVKLDGDCYVRAFEGDKIAEWGVYVTDAEGLPMYEAGFGMRSIAVARATYLAKSKGGWPVEVDELDGTTSTFTE